MRTKLTPRQKIDERRKAKRFWDSLYRWERFELGDQFVLGSFDWRDWMETKPTNYMLNVVDELRIDWNIAGLED